MAIRLLHYSDIETVYDSPERAARLAGLVRERREGAVVVGTGDNTGPGALAVVTEGEQALDFYEAVRPDVEVFGNHDFDFGPDVARRFVRESPCQWLAANLSDGDDPFAASEGAVPATLVERDGATVGLIGVTTPALLDMCPGASGVTVTDPLAAIRTHAERLRNSGAAYVVVCAHVGDEREMARELHDTVDAILDGHAHETVAEVEEGLPISRPPAVGDGINEIRLGPDPEVRTIDTSEGSPHEPLVCALKERISDAGLDETIVTASEPVSLGELPTNRGESRIGNFVTDAYRWAGDGDVAILAARGVREGDDLRGDVAAFDLVNTVPFDDELTVLSMDGDRLRSTLDYLDHGTHGPDQWEAYFGHVSGARLEWNGERELVSVRVGGEPLDPDRTYRLVTSDYYVETDHIFPTFGWDDVVSRPGIQYEALIEYARANDGFPPIEGRIRRPDEVEC